MLLEAFGWLGTALIVGAYFLNSFGKISAQSRTYQFMNIVGAVGIASVSFYKTAWQPAVLNVIWAVIGVIAISKSMGKTHHHDG